MAKGRMINSKVVFNRDFNYLSDDTSRLAFILLITFADVEGRTYGDPAIVRSLLFPRRTDITVERVETYIKEWYEAGLIVWYRDKRNGDKFIYFPGFDDNQVGLRKDKEAPSSLPAPPPPRIEPEPEPDSIETEEVEQLDVPSPELVRSNDGVSPEPVRKKVGLTEQNRTELKRKEKNRREEIDFSEIWNVMKTQLRKDMPDNPFAQWVEPTQFGYIQDGTIWIRAPSEDHVNFLNDRLLSTCNRLVKGLAGPEYKIAFEELEDEPIRQD